MQVTANGISIEYDTFGRPADRPLILIMGLVTQMIGWPEPFCRMLADRGHYVIRFDNRDCGLSSKMERFRPPDVFRAMADAEAGRPVTAPYTLSDMAADTVGLADALAFEKAHVCGMSMGGMIAQTIAIEHPGRLFSLISMASSTSEPDLPEPAPEAMEALVSLPPVDRRAFIDYMARVYRAFSGGSPDYDEAFQRRLTARAYDRSFYPIGFTRQMTAILASGGRRHRLKHVRTPALVIHGDCDALVPPAHGRDTAEALPNAAFSVIEGLGHGMAYPALWELMADVISAHTRRH